jgi:hypothetical protein
MISLFQDTLFTPQVQRSVTTSTIIATGSIDEGVLLTFYADADNDGYGNENVTNFCLHPSPGYVSDTSDCNDSNVLVNPASADICNNEDDNCNGVTDENGIMVTVSPSGTVSLCKDGELILTANTGTGISYQWQKNDHPIEGALNDTYTVSKAGSYSVKETNTFNCNATSPVTVVELLSLPSSTISRLEVLTFVSLVL